jgi:hypothetical protein
MPVSTAIRINKPTVAAYKYSLKYPSHFSSKHLDHSKAPESLQQITPDPQLQSANHQIKLAASTITFPEELPFRPHEHASRARSLSPARAAIASQTKKHSLSSLAIRVKNRAVDTSLSLPLRIMSQASNIAKARRGDSISMPVIAEGAEPGLAVVRSRATKPAATRKTDHTSALESSMLGMTIAQRVAYRRRKSVNAFIPRKARTTIKATAKARRAAVLRSRVSVFGAASLMDPAEMALSAALKKPQGRTSNHLSEIPLQTSLPTDGPAAKINNDSDKDDGESDEENRPVREVWSSADLRDEKERRLEIFNAHEKGCEALGQCGGCQEPIVGTRYECKFCDSFDLCRDCYTLPTVTFEHQHAADDLVVR